MMATMSAREFNQSVSAAQRLAEHEPLIVTRHGEPAFVLLNIGEYRRLTRPADARPLSQRLASSGGPVDDDVEFERVHDFGRPLPDL